MSSQAYPKQSDFIRNLQSFNANLIYEGLRKLSKRAFDINLALVGLMILFTLFEYISILI